MPQTRPGRPWLVSALVCACAIAGASAQDRLRRMPGYEQYTKVQPLLQGAVEPGTIQNLRWAADSRSFSYTARETAYRFDIETLSASVLPPAQRTNGRGNSRGRQGGPPPAVGRGGLEQAQAEMPSEPVGGCPGVRVPRGRQSECSPSPDGTLKAFYRARNFWIANADGTGERQITTDGSVERRIKNGTGSWVYGEELGQTTAIWWAPDSRKVAYYRFDESQVVDFYLAMNQTGLQTVMDVEAYPKPGTPNPIPEVFVFDLASQQSTKIDVRDGQPFSDDVVGHYVYDIRWAADASELYLTRANRRQQVVEFAACAPSMGGCRVVVREEWPTGWVDSRPGITWLSDRRRFIWNSERNGWTNYYLYDVGGRLLTPLTRHDGVDAGAIVKIDEKAGVLFYTARDGDNHLKFQLHRVNLDGSQPTRLTDPAFTHSIGSCAADAPGCGISPDNRYFVATVQRHDTPPATWLMAIESDGTARRVAKIAESDVSKLTTLHPHRPRQFTYTAADGKTPLIGQMAFPSTFDPAKKWPVLVSVYGGPASASNVPTENFAAPVANAEYGFLIVNLSSRAAPGLGRRALDALYLKLGVTEVDDMAEGIKALATLPYVDTGRIGIYGTSYGGYVSLMLLLRYPELVAAASVSSPPTSWHHYDSIYTERYMWTPQGNKEGYEAGNALNFVKNLRGRLLLYYGTADNNVHPNNSMQLIKALQDAGKSFEVQVGPDAGHSGVNTQRMMEFFIENLVMRPERLFGA